MEEWKQIEGYDKYLVSNLKKILKAKALKKNI